MAMATGSFAVQGEAEGNLQVNTNDTSLLSFRNGVFTMADSCFPGDTMVSMADGTARAIREVLPGDVVAGVDPFGARRAVRVEKAPKHEGNTDLIILEFEGGALASTPEHPIWCDELGFAKAVAIERGMHLRAAGGSPCVVEKARRERRDPHPVFNLTLDRASTRVYVAGGVLVHNK